MKIKHTTWCILSYMLMFFLHFWCWEMWVKQQEMTFIKYYLFLTLIFMMVLMVLTFVKRDFPQYIGFSFMGLVMFKLAVMFLIMKKLSLNIIPFYKFHFIPPYLFSLLLETLFAVQILKTEKNN